MKKLYTLLGALLIGVIAFGQTYNFDALTSGSTGTFTNGWASSTTTGYSWIAQAGPTISGGTGPEVDHTLGTATGIFMYTEASTPAAVGDTTMLTSPNMLVFGANPVLSFWYHRAGTDMGGLFIDVYNGTSWVLDVDSLIGSQQAGVTDSWINMLVDLSSFSGTVQVRFRAIYATGWSGDMAIDDVTIIDMPVYDAFLHGVTTTHPYYMTPASQVQLINFSAEFSNVGLDTITGVVVSGTLAPSGFPFSGSFGTLNPGDTGIVAISPTLTPFAVGQYVGDFTIGINEVDTVLINDSAQILFEVTDTVMSREDGISFAGIGFDGTTGIAGQMFEIIVQDSLSSVSFLLETPSVNQNVKVKLYDWNTTANTPGTLLDSSATVTVASATSVWITVQFTCDRILAPGKYFIGIEQLGTSNYGLGYKSSIHEANSTFFSQGATWATLESVGFEVALAVRMNLGPVSFPTVTLGADTGYCMGSSITLTAPSGWASYSWSNGATGINSSVSAADSNFWLQVLDSRGCAVRDTIVVTEYTTPLVNLIPTVGICNGASATLVANSNPLYTYNWNTGSTDSSITVSTGGLYAVTVTSDLGCTNTGFTTVVAGATPLADIGMDTIYYCAGSFTTVTALGSGNIYSWSDGTSGSTIQISQQGQIILTVTSAGSCVAYDTAWVVENPLPMVILSDTVLSFCDNAFGPLQVNVVSGATYLWSTGDTGPMITTNQAGPYWVTTTLDGCSLSDSGTATILVSPIVNLGLDTTICDTATIVLDAGPGSVWTWSNGGSTQTISVNTAGNYSVVVENTDGCAGNDTITVEVEICVGIFEATDNGLEIIAYPNPVSNVVTFDLSPELVNSKIKVVDAKGATVYQGTVTNQKETITVSDWAVGVYYVQIVNQGMIYTTKIVVQH